MFRLKLDLNLILSLYSKPYVHFEAHNYLLSSNIHQVS